MIFAEGLASPETPVFMPDDSLLVVESALTRGTVTLISQDGRANRPIAHTGRPNGLALARDQSVWVAESLKPSLVHATFDGATHVMATESPAGPFLFPNDLCFDSAGWLYMTDSGFVFEELVPDGKVRRDFASMRYDGKLYRIDVRTLDMRVLDTELEFANGVVLGPEGELYVNETLTGLVWRYERDFATKNRFGAVFTDPSTERLSGPDGMAVGADGSVYVAVWGRGEVTVLDSRGQVRERIKTAGNLPSNIAFGPNDERAIYVTEQERGIVERFDVPTSGCPVYLG
jgi:gluconolactonase